MSNKYTEEETKLADEIRQDMNDGKKLIDINAKRRQLNRLYAKSREDVASCEGEIPFLYNVQIDRRKNL